MPRRMTMLALRTRCKQRADKENDPHISDPEWNSLISEQYGDLYSVVAQSGLRYFETTHTITATVAARYDEPDDHLATVGVDFVIGTAGQVRPLMEIMAQEQPAWSGQVGEARAYTLIDDQILLFPKPTSGTYTLRYIAQPPDLSSYVDADILDVVTADGEGFIVWGAAVKALSKSESDVRLAMAEREAARGRLAEWAALRAFNSPRRRTVFGDDSDFDAADWRYR